jgi:hypothetical protein
MNGLATNSGVMIAERGQAVGTIFPNVLFVAHAQRALIQEANDCGENFFPGQPGLTQMAGNGFANRWENFSKIEHAIELIFGLQLAPSFVVAVLFAAFDIQTHGLEMAFGIGTDSHFAPGRRNREFFDALEEGAVFGGTIS